MKISMKARTINDLEKYCMMCRQYGHCPIMEADKRVIETCILRSGIEIGFHKALEVVTQDSINHKLDFLSRHGMILCWRHAFNCLEGGKKPKEDIYFVSDDKRFFIKIPKGSSHAVCLDIKELNMLPNEEDIKPIPDKIPEIKL